ncbi:hypothetical protein PGTUg99_002134 [Puccinia graminis f. sp. tritici]|uniref:Uncharacterized protein n=1 Tax=Puccinia graminis f. sp. tritici TaxID=56615 RepID=A0A5B0RZ72_PUCGR|nr:hypothetical protein PGTUg99_002134 [Puccinia graminis f. sp. tritici]
MSIDDRAKDQMNASVSPGIRANHYMGTITGASLIRFRFDRAIILIGIPSLPSPLSRMREESSRLDQNRPADCFAPVPVADET